MIRRANSRKLQYMWRVDGTGGKDNFALRIGALNYSPSLIFDRNRATAVEDNPVDLRFDDHIEIGALQGRPQIGARGTGPPTAAARLLAPADAVACTGW